jgi:formylglycine-generating enzyme required for sulfatase activity
MKTIYKELLTVLGALTLVVLIGPGCKQPAPPTPTTAKVIPMTNMVHIKAGTFLRIKQPATITREYWISRYEVTQSEFTELMGKNPSHFNSLTNAPVEKVKYFEAQAYCAALSKRERQAGRLPDGYVYRLPTEAEWEYACRAGTTNRFSFGDSEDQADLYAWTAENSDDTTHPVGQKKPNPWGLYDMHGNVYEWCYDWYEDYGPEPVTDPQGPAQNKGKGKVYRGGGWYHDAPFARSANRFGLPHNVGIFFVGFRVVLGKDLGVSP